MTFLLNDLCVMTDNASNMKSSLLSLLVYPAFPPFIPSRGAVAISPLLNFRKRGKYRLLEQRQNFPTF
jgi:hypothetical protein